MYYILANELVDEDNDAYLSGDVNLELGGDISFKRGEVVSGIPVPKIEFVLNDDSQAGNMTDSLSITELYGLVFSVRLQNFLNDLMVNNIQYFDLDIIDPKAKRVYTDYKIANVVGLVDCVDKEKSELKYHVSGNIKRIKKLILDESKIPAEMDIFRLPNRTVLTVVSERFKSAILEANITGCVFYKVEDYH